MNQPENLEHKVEFTLGRSLLWLLIAGLFTAMQIQQSLRTGRLISWFLFDDDSIYYVEALRRLMVFHEGGPDKLLLDFIQNGIHAPGGTLPAMLGFGLFGSYDWAPSAARGLVIFGLILFIAEYLCRGLPLIWKLAVVVLGLSWRIIGATVTEGRPDLTMALLAAMGILLITESNWLRSHWRKQVFTGVIWGLALLWKPTTSAVTVFLLLSTLITASLVDWCRNKNLSAQIIPVNLRCIGVTIAVAFMHYAINWRGILGYIDMVLFGKSSREFHQNLSFFDHGLYYLSGAAGRWLIGYHWLGILLVLIVLCSIHFWYQQRQNVWQSMPLATVIMLIITWLSVSIPKTKTPHIGAVFPALIFFVALYLIIYLIRFYQSASYRQKLTFYGGMSLLTVLAIGQLKWPAARYDVASAQKVRAITQEIAVDLAQQVKPEELIVELSYWYSSVANYHTLKTGIDPQLLGVTFSHQDLANAVKLFNQADYIFFDTGYVDSLERDLDNGKITKSDYDTAQQLIRELNTPEFQRLKQYPNPYPLEAGRTLFLYQRVKS
ncbi:hypothetical protein GlitD10_2319 [Gloeomargarita lithophora Alchichica-D10]|uniref:Glycosyltransferase RgtA/B/C/D-like domain-containing protein n=1 Tax=Gloeomargarita lithophora Alchichica-D10 TaxID=1188229 RepID=A0A1J0AFF3_9CYAN|nr:hypothetical protein [Gloeomargarita lithophora]APB34653.1 hypothetical protein GlitD10_2319 [Gloeomargarita lithophora Alchichica-D10]